MHCLHFEDTVHFGKYIDIQELSRRFPVHVEVYNRGKVVGYINVLLHLIPKISRRFALF